MKFLTLLLITLTISLFIVPSEEKKVNKTIHSKTLFKDGFVYFTKFGIDIGEGNYTVKARIIKSGLFNWKKTNINPEENKVIEIDFLQILDKDYQVMDQNASCTDKYEAAQKKRKLKINTNSEWSEIQNVKLSQLQRQYVWYFAIGSCDQNMEYLKDQGFNIQFEFEIFNSNGSHFSSEETGMPTLYVILCLGSVIGLIYIFLQNQKQNRERDYPILILLVGLGFLVLHCFFYYGQLLSYGSNGKGSLFLRILAAMFDTLSQISLTLLLILLSMGWSINTEKLPNQKTVILICGAITFVQLFVTYQGFRDYEAALKYHHYQGIIGFLVIFIRLCVFGYFIYNLLETMKSTKNNIKDFTNKLLICGSFYIIALPVAIMIGSMMAFYLQHRFITFINIIFQIGCIVYLSLSFLSKNSGYQKVAMKNRTELPSAFGSKFD